MTVPTNSVIRETRRPRRARRVGVAATELAVCMPAIILLVLITIESCSMIFLDQTLTIAAYEGARVAADPRSESTDVVAECTNILTARQVSGASVTTTPADVTTAKSGEYITITVTAPFAANSICPDWFFDGKILTTQVVMVRE